MVELDDGDDDDNDAIDIDADICGPICVLEFGSSFRLFSGGPEG